MKLITPLIILGVTVTIIDNVLGKSERKDLYKQDKKEEYDREKGKGGGGVFAKIGGAFKWLWGVITGNKATNTDAIVPEEVFVSKRRKSPPKRINFGKPKPKNDPTQPKDDIISNTFSEDPLPVIKLEKIPVRLKDASIKYKDDIKNETASFINYLETHGRQEEAQLFKAKEEEFGNELAPCFKRYKLINDEAHKVFDEVHKSRRQLKYFRKGVQYEDQQLSKLWFQCRCLHCILTRQGVDHKTLDSTGIDAIQSQDYSQDWED